MYVTIQASKFKTISQRSWKGMTNMETYLWAFEKEYLYFWMMLVKLKSILKIVAVADRNISLCPRTFHSFLLFEFLISSPALSKQQINKVQ